MVSEPMTDLAGSWNEVPASHYGVIEPGVDGPCEHSFPELVVGAGRRRVIG